MKKWIDLVIPIILIIGSFTLLGLGVDGEVKAILTLAAGWVFGVFYVNIKK